MFGGLDVTKLITRDIDKSKLLSISRVSEVQCENESGCGLLTCAELKELRFAHHKAAELA